MNKINFKTILNYDNSKYISESGSPLLAEYAFSVDKEGVEHLKPTGEFINIYERIQADYPSTDINRLMERFALGDTEAINIKDGFYADVTKMPTNYAELFNMNVQCKQYFDELPVDLKEMFDNSYTEFFAEMDSDRKSFNEKVEKYNSRFELSPEFNEKTEIKSDVKAGDSNE